MALAQRPGQGIPPTAGWRIRIEKLREAVGEHTEYNCGRKEGRNVEQPSLRTARWLRRGQRKPQRGLPGRADWRPDLRRAHVLMLCLLRKEGSMSHRTEEGIRHWRQLGGCTSDRFPSRPGPRNEGCLHSTDFLFHSRVCQNLSRPCLPQVLVNTESDGQVRSGRVSKGAEYTLARDLL